MMALLLKLFMTFIKNSLNFEILKISLILQLHFNYN
jgi:hypothetical protein